MQEAATKSIVSTRSSVDSSTAPAEDRRRHPRYMLSLAITMQGDNNFYTGLSENISEAGVFIATYKLLAVGTPVVLSFTLPNMVEPISVVGSVQWVRGPGATAKPSDIFGGQTVGVLAPGMGVQFTDVDDVAIHAIRAFMQRRTPEFFE